MDGVDRVVILNDFWSSEGGAGYLAGALASGIAARGMDVTMMTVDSDNAGHAGVDHISLGGEGLLKRAPLSAALGGVYNREASGRLRNWIDRNDTPGTVYHLHNWSDILSPAIFDALRSVSRRTAIHAHDYFLACPNGAFLDYPRAEVCTRKPLSATCLTTGCDKRAIAHKVWRVGRHAVLLSRLRAHLRTATFVAIHPAMPDVLRRAITPQRIKVIRNPVSAFGPTVPRSDRERGIVHIDQVQRLKGVYDLAEAGRKLGLTVDYYGSGENLDDLRARYPEHRYHGWTDRETLGEALRAARVVVVGSQSPEPFCMAAFEAVATGVPLIVSDAILAAPELVNAGAALSYPGGQVTALAQTLSRIMASDALTAQLATAARANGPALGHGMEDWLDAHQVLYRGLAQPDAQTIGGRDVLAST